VKYVELSEVDYGGKGYLMAIGQVGLQTAVIVLGFCEKMV
jgi:hypothetical protein